MFKNLSSTVQTSGSVTGTTNGAAIPMDHGQEFSAALVITAASSPSSATVQLQKSNDNVNWAAEGSAVSVTATTAAGVCLWIESKEPTAAYMRLQYYTASGSFACAATILIKGDR